MGLFKSKEEEKIPSIEPKAPVELKTVQTFPTELPTNYIQKNDTPEKPKPIEKFPPQTREINTPRGGLDEPFFVRIDKFKTSKENLDKISERITEIDRIIDSFEQIKKKEDIEVEDLKEQTKEIKEFLVEIDQNMFNKL